jgi:hypothetical protein
MRSPLPASSVRTAGFHGSGKVQVSRHGLALPESHFEVATLHRVSTGYADDDRERILIVRFDDDLPRLVRAASARIPHSPLSRLIGTPAAFARLSSTISLFVDDTDAVRRSGRPSCCRQRSARGRDIRPAGSAAAFMGDRRCLDAQRALLTELVKQDRSVFLLRESQLSLAAGRGKSFEFSSRGERRCGRNPTGR